MKFQDLEIGEIYKFVEVDGEFIFFRYFQTHSEFVPDGKTAQSAGMISYRPGGLEIIESYSMTCKVGIGDLGKIRMANKLNIPVWSPCGEKWVPPITELPDWLKDD